MNSVSIKTFKGPQRVRHWLQFSVRSLCIAITLFCLWLGWQVNRARRDKAAVELARSLHAHFYFDDECELSSGRDGYRFKKDTSPRGPRWLRRIIGDQYFRRIVVLAIEWQPITDDDLERIVAVMPDLWALHLENTEITNAGLIHLRGLRRLRQLALSRNKIGSTGLAHVRGLTELRWLDLDLTNADDDALEYLRGLPLLSSLSLQLTGVTDAGLPELVKLPALRHFLDLNGTSVTDAGIDALKRLTRLEHLELGRTNVTAQGIRTLRETLRETTITQHETRGYENRNQILK